MSSAKAAKNFFVEGEFSNWSGTHRVKWGPAPTADGGFSMKISMLVEGSRGTSKQRYWRAKRRAT